MKFQVIPTSRVQPLIMCVLILGALQSLLVTRAFVIPSFTSTSTFLSSRSAVGNKNFPSSNPRKNQQQLQHPFLSATTTPTSLWQASTAQTEAQAWTQDEEVTDTDFVICGGGPAGLLGAIMLAQKYPNKQIKLYDRLSPPPKPTDDEVWDDVARFYLIGLGSRGQNALERFGVLDKVKAASVAVIGRKDWAPDAEEGVERIFEDRKVQTIVLPRDKLAGILYWHLVDNFADRVELNYGYEIQPLDFGEDSENGKVYVRASQCSPAVSNIAASEEKTASEQQQDVLCDTDSSTVISTNLLLAADGTVRTVANAMQHLDAEARQQMNPLQRVMAGKPFQVLRYPDDNRRIYKTIPLTLPKEWRGDLNYSARSKGSRVVFDALPANDRNEYCGVLLLRETDSLAQANASPTELREVLDEALPSFSALMDDDLVAQIAKKPPSYLPAFRYAGPRLNQGDATLLLGDCAHTVKPYFGLGANSALEDVMVLSGIIDESDSMGEAVNTFSKRRAIEAKKLVTISRELDRPGALGFVTFILPIILDAIFHKSFPKVFSPNVITMLQRDDLTFKQVARKKRLDRLGQVAILGSVFYGMFAASRFAIRTFAKLLGKSATTVTAGIAATCVGAFLIKKLVPFLVPGMAPADVMTKTNSKIVPEEK